MCIQLREKEEIKDDVLIDDFLSLDSETSETLTELDILDNVKNKNKTAMNCDEDGNDHDAEIKPSGANGKGLWKRPQEELDLQPRLSMKSSIYPTTPQTLASASNRQSKAGVSLQNFSPSKDNSFSFNVSLSVGGWTPLLYDLTTPQKRNDSCNV
ncbi:hypothetical protein AVEN_92160-1 [Araneus ventricosus]|uniref:Uncharacterized protein n=1 Tax=Araneus ventricosus TaxID=182803 RepID=A0A4Y2GD18_ARAVE|nr:hypothetical protein AVEN_92160-1 [Araneus ventricosus]